MKNSWTGQLWPAKVRTGGKAVQQAATSTRTVASACGVPKVSSTLRQVSPSAFRVPQGPRTTCKATLTVSCVPSDISLNKNTADLVNPVLRLVLPQARVPALARPVPRIVAPSDRPPKAKTNACALPLTKEKA